MTNGFMVPKEMQGGKLWLWRNGPGRYWAFNNPYPCRPDGGDPLVLGEPVGVAEFLQSTNGNPDEDESIAETAIAALDPSRRAPSVTREEIASALCKADGTSQCAAICLTRFARDNREGKCTDALRVWGRNADAILALLRDNP